MNQTGTKLACDECGAQLAVTRGGDGQVHCCDRPMTVTAGGAQTRQSTPASDTPIDDPFYD